MNREQYNSDPRYAKVLEQMDLLGIMDITTTKQHKNGTIVWKLPILNNWPNRNGIQSFIEVASFASGYVRNNNSGYSNYQLNKTYKGKDYIPLTDAETGRPVIRTFETIKRKLIPIEIDRLEYLISYCLKNYFIKRANEVADGKLIPKWKYDEKIYQAHNKHNKAYNDGYTAAEVDYKGMIDNLSVTVNGHRYKVI